MSFFKLLLQLGIGPGDHWPRLSQAESEPPEEPLALAHAEFDAPSPTDELG